jgi:hypothetical protein
MFFGKIISYTCDLHLKLNILKLKHNFFMKWLENESWRAPKLLDRLKCEYEVKTTEEQGVGAHSLARSTLEVEGRARVSGWG